MNKNIFKLLDFIFTNGLVYFVTSAMGLLGCWMAIAPWFYTNTSFGASLGISAVGVVIVFYMGCVAYSWDGFRKFLIGDPIKTRVK